MVKMKTCHTSQFMKTIYGQTYFKLTVDPEYKDFVSRLVCVERVDTIGGNSYLVYIDDRVQDVTEAFDYIVAELSCEIDRIENNNQ